jgi:hypothetical protein
MSLEEFLARMLAARKIGLIEDPRGILLPEDLWKQSLPDAQFVLGAIQAYEIQKVVLAFHDEDEGE